MNAPGRGRFTMIDENEDGVISAEEAASAVDQVFTAMDTDDDAALTMDEYLAVRMGSGEGWNPERQAARQAAKKARYTENGHQQERKCRRPSSSMGARRTSSRPMPTTTAR